MVVAQIINRKVYVQDDIV